MRSRTEEEIFSFSSKQTTVSNNCPLNVGMMRSSPIFDHYVSLNKAIVLLDYTIGAKEAKDTKQCLLAVECIKRTVSKTPPRLSHEIVQKQMNNINQIDVRPLGQTQPSSPVMLQRISRYYRPAIRQAPLVVNRLDKLGFGNKMQKHLLRRADKVPPTRSWAAK